MTSATAPNPVDSSLPAGVTSLASEQQKQTTASGTLGQGDFLKLMTAQLKNQDPMAPMDNGQFLGQMAQFSTVSSLGDMATQLKALSDQMAGSRLLSSGSLIGRSVLSPSNVGDLPAGGSLDGVVRLAEPADGATVTVRNAVGQIMESFNLGPSVSGDYPFSWDGALQGGATAQPGKYQVDVSVSRAGKASAEAALLYMPVASVSMAGGDIKLNLQNGSSLPLSQVTNLR
jgi:flagellar basal-body rod modification protein FlgD